MANYFPAVLEAYNDRQPLIILSADRPFELQDCGANQTIRQTHLFGDYCAASLALPEPSEAVSPSRLWFRLKSLIEVARRSRRPVHINLPLREPLEPVHQAISEPYLASLRADICSPLAPLPTDEGEIGAWKTAWEAARSQHKTWLVVVGGLPPAVVQDSEEMARIATWLKACPTTIYCDVTASLKHHLSTHAGLLVDPEQPSILAHLKARLKAQLKAQQGDTAILHIGDRITSGPIQRLLNEATGCYIRLSPSEDAFNPGGNITQNYRAAIGPALACATPPASSSEPLLPKTPTAAEATADKRCMAAEAIVAAVGEDDVLYLGNSSVIRVFNRIVCPPAHSRSGHVVANRGVSGIEGLVSSAKGYHHSSGQRVVLVLGDISFLYDLGALLDPYLTADIKIILFNDQKGSIFANLPGRHHDGFINELMTTPHQLTFGRLLQGFPIAAESTTIGADAGADLSSSLSRLMASTKPALLELILD